MVTHDLNVHLLDDLGRIFDWQPDPAQYFATPAAEQLRQGLRSSLESNHGVTLLTGGAGAGKTLLLQLSLQDLNARWAHVAQLSYTSMSGAEILRSMAYAFGMPAGHGDTPAPAAWTEDRLLYWARRGEASLLVVDEAHNLPRDALEPLLAMSERREGGRPLLQLILVGRPASLDLVARDIKAAFALPAFMPHESAAYIADRLRQLAAAGIPALSATVVAEIHARTQGRPGRINLLCKQLLQNAVLLEEDAVIDTAAVKAGADDLGFEVASVLEAAPISAGAMPDPPAPAAAAPIDTPVVLAEPMPAVRTTRVLPAVLLLLLAAVGTGAFLVQPGTPTPAPTTAAVHPPPATASHETKVASEPAPPIVQTQHESPQDPPPIAHEAEPMEAVQLLPPAPRQATPPAKPVVAVAARLTPSRPANAHCAHLLAQLSLGEPLSTGQQHTLESTCR